MNLWVIFQIQTLVVGRRCSLGWLCIVELDNSLPPYLTQALESVRESGCVHIAVVYERVQ
jgi:hypothetical protein